MELGAEKSSLFCLMGGKLPAESSFEARGRFDRPKPRADSCQGGGLIGSGRSYLLSLGKEASLGAGLQWYRKGGHSVGYPR